jgi:hypothetical protein
MTRPIGNLRKKQRRLLRQLRKTIKNIDAVLHYGRRMGIPTRVKGVESGE